MSDTKDRLYELLPVVYRQRDAEQGWPLKALLQVIAEQVDVVEDDIAQLYENWFIETCEDWVVPYIGDLIGYRPVHEAGEPGEVMTSRGQQRNKMLIPRREVANTIRYRRRKGTLALLELLARDVAGWPARAVEFYKLLGWAQAINHLRPDRGQTVDLSHGDALDRLGGPFDELAHTVDVRRIASHRIQGRYNIPSVGLFVWRLKAYSVTETPAYCAEGVGSHCYTFSVLGNDTPLYTRPESEAEPTDIAGELNLPVPIRRRVLETRKTDYYGEGKSLQIWLGVSPRFTITEQTLEDLKAEEVPDDVLEKLVSLKDQMFKVRKKLLDTLKETIGDEQTDQYQSFILKHAEVSREPVPPEHVVVADLSGWQYRPRRGQVAVDPQLGRIAFPPRQLPKKGVWVYYYYGFSADIGGGEYDRPLFQPGEHVIYRVGQNEELKRINDALSQWQHDWQEAEQPQRDRLSHAVIEITDSGVYVEQISIKLEENQSLQLRAANLTRPIIRLLDWKTHLPDNLSVAGASGSRFTLDGLLITGRGVQVEGELTTITIRHSTLVPGWTLDPDCEPEQPTEPSLELVNTRACVIIEHSIVGSIQVSQDEVRTDPIQIHISDSILDATSPEQEALGAPGWPVAHAVLTIARSTVFGQIQTHAINLAENSIFIGLIKVARRQQGCMRFCYVTPGSRTPRRYRCQPDLVEKPIKERFNQGEISADERNRALERERLRVRPQFNSIHYGTPTYCQLADICAEEIKRGADDESEMGVFHDLYQPQRAANLRARLNEYTPAGMDAGIIYAS